MDSSSSSTGSEEEALIKNIEESMVAMMETSPTEEAFMAEMEAELVGSNSQRRRRGTRRYIDRDRVGGHERLMADYFFDNPVYPDYMFHRRFWMRRPLFVHLVEALGEWSPYFTQRRDVLNNLGLSPYQKCTAALRMLAYGCPADSIDEYMRIGESTAIACLKNFVEGVDSLLGEEYLQTPNVQDLQYLLHQAESRGFPGMLGSLDCMHWEWRNFPNAWRGQFTRGDHGVPTIMLEVVAPQDLWIWHAFFSVASSNNDINVLNQSPLFTEVLRGEAPKVRYSVNGNEYNMGYYLVDGIYPEWAVFVKTIPLPQTEKAKLFAQHQEGARKDVEQAFGVLQARFAILHRLTHFWKRSTLAKIMKACVILHNMIIEDERD